MGMNLSASLAVEKTVEVRDHGQGMFTLSWGSPLVIAMQREDAIALARAIVLAALPEAAE